MYSPKLASQPTIVEELVPDMVVSVFEMSWNEIYTCFQNNRCHSAECARCADCIDQTLTRRQKQPTTNSRTSEQVGKSSSTIFYVVSMLHCRCHKILRFCFVAMTICMMLIGGCEVDEASVDTSSFVESPADGFKH